MAGIASGGDERTEEVLVERKRAFRMLLQELSLQAVRAPLGLDMDAAAAYAVPVSPRPKPRARSPTPFSLPTGCRETEADPTKLLTAGELDQIYQPGDSADLPSMEPAPSMVYTLRTYQKQVRLPGWRLRAHRG